MKTVYLSLGSNLGDREAHLRAALERIPSPRLQIRRLSSVYETAPLELADQPPFLNLVAEIETDLFPMQLLERLQRIEGELGRIRTIPKGPRTIDIDILLYGPFVIQSSRLVTPHPRLHERRFVLEPLAELAPQLRHPVLKMTMAEMRTSVLDQAVTRTNIRIPIPPSKPQAPGG